MAIGTLSHNEDMAQREREKSIHRREIALLYEDNRDWKEWEKCKFDLERYLRTIYPKAFDKPFSRDHKKAIGKAESIAINGGQHALAMPRGSGKTTIYERTMIWSQSYAHRRFGVLIGATERASLKNMMKIKNELRWNDLLATQYPEIAYPIRRLQNDGKRARGQLWNGEETLIEWSPNTVRFAQIPPAVDRGNAGATLLVAAITGAFKGQAAPLRDGTIIRPDFVLLDDPQTRESAKSLIQTGDREEIIMGDVLGLAAQSENMACAMAITPIYPGDLAMRFLDRNLHPEWQGDRTRMVYSFPSNMDLWEQYAEVRSDELKNDGDGSKSREFYINHRDAMDDGAELSWPENFRKGYVSAIQDAMDRRFRSYNAFMAEYQCDPLEDTEGRGFSMTAADIVSKINGYRAGVVPSQAEILTGFIDVHGEVLFYCIIAWKPDFTGWIVEYGTFPKQNRKYFALADANPIMSKYLATEYIELRGQATEPIVAKGLSLLLADLTEREWKKDDGNSITLSRLLIDTGWKDEIVYGCIRMLNQKPVSLPIVMGSKGKGITATKKPFSSYTKHPGDIVGSRWRSPKPEKGRQRIVHIDTNYYKSFVHSRLFVPLQASGSISLFGEDPRKADHTLISEHLTAEIPKEVFSKTDNQTVVEWQKKPNADNHWLDCVVGCCAAASSCGCALPEAMSETPKVSRKEAEQEFMASLKRRGVV